MRVKLVVVVEPFRQRSDNGLRIGCRIDADIVAFDRTHESLGHSIRLWTLHGSRQRLEADLASKLACFSSNVAGGVVGQPFDRRRQSIDCKRSLHPIAKALAIWIATRWRNGLHFVAATRCKGLVDRTGMRAFDENYNVRPNAQGMSSSIRDCGWPAAIASSVAFIQT